MKKPHRLVLATALATSALGLTAGSASAYPVVCNDGTLSDAGGRQGACSHHGGVAGPATGGGSTPTTPSTPTIPTVPTTPITPAAPAAPVDLSPPRISAPIGSLGTVGSGKPFTPPAIGVSDDVAWPAGGYAVTVTWGDGSQEQVPFPGVSAPYVSVSVPLPPHIYVHGGSFSISASVTDPAGHVTTTPVTTATITPALIAPAGFPKLTGTPRAGRTLTCRTGNWGDPDADVAIRWRANGRLIPDAAGRAFRARPRDKGRRITCQVVESNDAFRASATSNALRIGSAR